MIKMRRCVTLVLIVTIVMSLSACKYDERVEQCFVDGSFLPDTGFAEPLPIATIVGEVKYVEIVRVESYHSDEYFIDNGVTDFKVSSIFSFGSLEEDSSILRFPVYCREFEVDDDVEYYAEYFEGKNSTGLILLDKYYMVFVVDEGESLFVKYYYILDGYDVGEEYNNQNEEINSLVEQVEDAVTD